MKWFIRIILLIIGAFLLAAGIGYFISPQIKVERSAEVYAMPEDIFPYLSNLESHEVWSPWHDGEYHKGFQVSQSVDGVGQTSAWICQSNDCLPGTEVIMAVQYPGYVQTDLNLDGQTARAIYGLAENNNGSTTILLGVEKELGGFPYVQRLFKFREVSALETRLDRALSQLSELLKADGMAD